MNNYNSVVILVSADMPLDKNSFIYNKHYARAKIAALNPNALVSTSEGRVDTDQIWMLEKSNRNPGYYYIKSAKYAGQCLADSKRKLVIYGGHYFKDQLWRLQKEGDYYRIYNKYHPQSKVTKYGKANNQITVYRGRHYEDQLWKLVPRFTATAREYVIWSIDNR